MCNRFAIPPKRNIISSDLLSFSLSVPKNVWWWWYMLTLNHSHYFDIQIVRVIV